MKGLLWVLVVAGTLGAWGRDRLEQAAEAWTQTTCEALQLDDVQRKEWNDALRYAFVSNRFAEAEEKVRRLTLSEDKLAELTADERKVFGRFLRDLKCTRDELRARLLIEGSKMSDEQRSRLAAFMRYREERRRRKTQTAMPVVVTNSVPERAAVTNVVPEKAVVTNSVPEKPVARQTGAEKRKSVLLMLMEEVGMEIPPAK